MSNLRPRVSIGMPVHNGAAHLVAALDSVLAQTFGDYELILSDNASSDGTEQIGREYASRDERIRYYRNEQNLGAAANFNRVFELSTGDYFKWMSHDDILAPQYLERCVEMLDKAPESVVLCFTGRRWMTPEGKLLGAAQEPGDTEVPAPFHRISFARLVRQPGSRFPMFVFGLMRSSALRKTALIGPYNAADLVLVAELRLLGELWQIPEDLFFERLHEPTPEWKLARQTALGEAIWYDPDNRDRLPLPRLRLFYEYMAAIHRSPAQPLHKLACAAAVAVGRPWAQLWLWSRPVRIAGWRCWSRLSVGAARTSRRVSAPLRLWAAVSCVRRRQYAASARFLTASWPRVEGDLLGFAAERLSRRPDAAAHGLLADWLSGPCDLRQWAAARAIARRPRQFQRILQDRFHGDATTAVVRELASSLAEQ